MSGHGTRSRYVDDFCRCEACTAANREHQAHRRAQRRVYVEANGLPSSIQHGLSAYANWGCRCAVCYAAKSADNKARRS